MIACFPAAKTLNTGPFYPGTQGLFWGGSHIEKRKNLFFLSPDTNADIFFNTNILTAKRGL